MGSYIDVLTRLKGLVSWCALRRVGIEYIVHLYILGLRKSTVEPNNKQTLIQLPNKIKLYFSLALSLSFET